MVNLPACNPGYRLPFQRTKMCCILPPTVRSPKSYTEYLDKISSRIFVTLRYRDEDPIVEEPDAVIIENYASVTIISIQRKTYTYRKILTLSIHIQKQAALLKICANVYLIEFTNSQ